MSTSPAAQAAFYASTADSLPAEPAVVPVTDGRPHVAVYPEATRQTIEGFGGCFNERGWRALSVLDPAARREVLRRLFDPSAGLGLRVCRVPIGANDYAVDRYSLNETDGDVEMTRFSIERDRVSLIPYIREALAVQPKLRLWGCAWSPPTWMKDNRSFDSGNFLDDPRIYRAYALYLLKFIRAYRAEGLAMEAVAVQNEPGTLTNYPSCDWTQVQYLVFIRDHLGPLFREEGLRDAIMLGTFNQPMLMGHALTVLTDERARRYVSSGGLQWYAFELAKQMKAVAPGLKLWQTETDCGNWPWMPGFNPETPPNDAGYACFTWEKIRDWLKAGVTVYDLWNMVLEPTGKNIDSKRAWPQNSPITIDPETRAVRYTPMYAAVASFARFVPPGSQVVETEGPIGDAVGFVDPAGRTIVSLFNRKGTRDTIPVLVRDRVYGVGMEPLSFGTLVVEPV